MRIVGKNIVKTFNSTMSPVKVLKGIDVVIEPGEFVSIIGKSGSGKSTLLYILSTLDQPTEGQLLYDNIDPFALSEDDLHMLRNQKIGFVFQFHHLLPELTALENVLLPARKLNQHLQKQDEAKALLDSFGLADKAHRLPRHLSGGEQQRCALARALIMRPSVLFADEPTGNLDSQNGEIVIGLFEKINREQKMSIVMVTHDPDFSKRAHREVILVDGRLD
ncbi:MAG: ABC transporter ATP-binding protein [Bacteriovoracaceae bacterium]